MHILVWHSGMCFPPASYLSQKKLVSSSSHCLVMRETLHVRLVEIILKDSMKYTDYNVLA